MKVGIRFIMNRYQLFCFWAIMLGSLSTKALKEYKKCSYHYFTSGKISTSICYDDQNRWGQALAFDKTGNVIYEKDLRKIAGNSSVSFSYYDDGSVSKAEWHSAPDGGIQWYSATTNFSNDGKIVSEVNNSYDDKPGDYLLPEKHKPETWKQRETAISSTMFVSEFWFINKTSFNINIEIASKGAPATKRILSLHPNDTLKGGEQLMAGQFADISQFYEFKAIPVKKRVKKEFKIILSPLTYNTGKKEVKRFYFLVW